MKKRSRSVRFLKSFLSAMSIVLATAPHAMANNSPAPAGLALTFLVLVLLVVLTLAGGGSGVIGRLNALKYPSKARRALASLMEFIAGAVLFFIGTVIVPFIGLAVFSIYAIVRGVKMIWWGHAAGKNQPRPAHLEGVSPKRLKAAGIILICLTMIVLGYSIINFYEVTGFNYYRERAYASALNADARNAYTAAEAYLEDNPEAETVTCADMGKMGYKPSDEQFTCISDMTRSSGGITITGPESGAGKNLKAVITHSGELSAAQP